MHFNHRFTHCLRNLKIKFGSDDWETVEVALKELRSIDNADEWSLDGDDLLSAVVYHVIDLMNDVMEHLSRGLLEGVRSVVEESTPATTTDNPILIFQRRCAALQKYLHGGQSTPEWTIASLFLESAKHSRDGQGLVLVAKPTLRRHPYIGSIRPDDAKYEINKRAFRDSVERLLLEAGNENEVVTLINKSENARYMDVAFLRDEVVAKQGKLLRELPPPYNKTFDLVLAAAKNDPSILDDEETFRYLPKHDSNSDQDGSPLLQLLTIMLQKHKDPIRAVDEANKYGLPRENAKEYYDFVSQALQENAKVIEHVEFYQKKKKITIDDDDDADDTDDADENDDAKDTPLFSEKQEAALYDLAYGKIWKEAFQSVYESKRSELDDAQIETMLRANKKYLDTTFIIQKVIAAHGERIRLVPDEYQRNLDVVSAVIRLNPDQNFAYILPDMQKREDVLKVLIRASSSFGIDTAIRLIGTPLHVAKKYGYGDWASAANRKEATERFLKTVTDELLSVASEKRASRVFLERLKDMLTTAIASSPDGITDAQVSEVGELRLPPEWLDAFLKDLDTQPRDGPTDSGAASEQGSDGGSSPLLIKDDPKYATFFKMLAMHVPRGAVENKMRTAGIDPEILDRPKDASPNQPESESKADSKSDSAAGPELQRPTTNLLALAVLKVLNAHEEVSLVKTERNDDKISERLEKKTKWHYTIKNIKYPFSKREADGLTFRYRDRDGIQREREFDVLEVIRQNVNVLKDTQARFEFVASLCPALLDSGLGVGRQDVDSLKNILRLGEFEMSAGFV